VNTTLTAAFVQQFHDSFVMAAQQKVSRLQAAVTDRGMIQGASFTINDVGAVEAQQVTNRYGDTEWTVPDHGTRQALMTDWDLALPVDKNDLPKLFANPQGTYLEMSLAAHNRRKDKVIYQALIDPTLRKTDQAGAFSPVSLPAGQIILNGGTGMTKAKLLTARKLFRKNESDENNGEELYITYDGETLEDLLADTTLTSADFLAVQMLQSGDLKGKWLGFNWIPYENLLVTGSVRSNVAWTKSACHFGMGDNIVTDVGPRRDKRNAIQVYTSMSLGAGRAKETDVVRIDFV